MKTDYFSADMEVRRKAISIVLSMTSTRNVEEVVLFLKKQLQKTQEADFDKVTHSVLPGNPRLPLNNLAHRHQSTDNS